MADNRPPLEPCAGLDGMTWDRTTALTNPANARTERLFDLSLYLLTAVVSATLVACVVFLAWRWLSPIAPPSPLVSVQSVQRAAPPPTEDAGPGSAASAEILLRPGQMYRCERGRVVSYSDRPCVEGLSRVMNLPEQK